MLAAREDGLADQLSRHAEIGKPRGKLGPVPLHIYRLAALRSRNELRDLKRKLCAGHDRTPNTISANRSRWLTDADRYFWPSNRAKAVRRWPDGGTRPRRAPSYSPPQTSFAVSTISASFLHCASSVRMLPSSVEANPHCGERQNWSSGANFVASSMRRSMAAFSSSSPRLRGDEPEHHPLVAPGQEAQRLEAAGAVGVVFEEIAVIVASRRAGSRPPARSPLRKSRWSGNCRGRHASSPPCRPAGPRSRG